MLHAVGFTREDFKKRRKLLEEPAEDPKAVLLDMPSVGEDADFARIRELPRRIDL